MTALTADRTTPRRDRGGILARPVAAGVKIFNGALVVLDADRNARPGYAAAGLIADGVSRTYVDNTAGVAGAQVIEVEAGCYPFANSQGADAIAQADIGSQAYIVDDQTVAKTNGGGARSAAGVILDVTPRGVWVGVGILHP